MFKKATKFIRNQVDPCKEMIPVESIADNEHFRPLCLLTKKRKSNTIFHPAPYYKRTGLTLDDVLLPGKDGKPIVLSLCSPGIISESIHQDSSQCTLIQTSAEQLDGDLSISVDPAIVGLQGAASSSNEFSIKPQKKSVSLQSLEELRRERKINMDHSFIQQLQKRGIKLYLVTETLEASEEAVYKESTKAGGGFMAKIYATLSAQGTRENSQGIIIPKGCTLAFRTMQLHIRDGAWYNPVTDLDSFWFAGPSLGILGAVLKEVKYSCRILPMLSRDLLALILNTIKAVMRDNNLLQELSQKMEEVAEQNDGYELKTQSPDLQALFSTLQHSPRDCLLQLAEGITYILDALHELMEDQLLLLLESLERKIVSQQLKLVEKLLKHDLEYRMQPFHLDVELLSFSDVEEQKLTIALVELSGVQLQEDGSALPRDQPFEDVAALFVALYALNLLSASK
ncbi:hypothetical protein HGM15179_020780 [Zosterops borbonicus]|uniref:Gasdermin-A n=1 Tax=Zosterops borbonicus TaxID=364589 RepID=A0A8K1D743_9PASS|nr:hypothetical protein HGM15179_020780 [Zosterops borbonicus]